MKKLGALILVSAMTLMFAACGKGEETTVTGLVMSVDGTTVTLREFDSEAMSEEMQNISQGRGSFGGFTPGEDFDPSNMPEGFGGRGDFDPENMPEGFDKENIPEGFEPGNFDRENMPEGFGGGNMTIPEGESTEIDLADAHISVESDGVKASGSLDDISRGSYLTITLDKKGRATNVTVSSMSFSGGFRQRGRSDGQQ